MNKRTPPISLALIWSVLASGLLLGCWDKTTSPYNTWRFSGYVVDGSTDKALPQAHVFYEDNDGNGAGVKVDSTGHFSIGGLAFGEKTFRFKVEADSGEPSYTERLLMVAGMSESNALQGDIGGKSAVITLYPLTGSLSGKLAVKIRGGNRITPAARVAVKLSLVDSGLFHTTAGVYQTSTSDSGTFTLGRLPVASNLNFEIPDLIINGLSYAATKVSRPVLVAGKQVNIGIIYLESSDSTDLSANILASNVLSQEGFGRTGIPVDEDPYYVLSVHPDPSTLQVSITGGGAPMATVRVSGDTVFVHPVSNFTYNESVQITITGADKAGNRLNIVLGGSKQFTTEAGIYALASNTWDEKGAPARGFNLMDTLWVRFSGNLDSAQGAVAWDTSDADLDIFGSGARTNAEFWISQDTLFVRPDRRLGAEFDKTMGFKVTVLSANGKRSKPLDVKVHLQENPYYIAWTNTRDFLGNVRHDFGVLDEVVVVSHQPVDKVLRIQGADGGSTPPNLTLDNLTVKGDTLIYKPSLQLAPQGVYAIKFDILFKNGVTRTGVDSVNWGTRRGVEIVAVDNRKEGRYRPLALIGDSVAVTFSEPIDTSSRAPLRFQANVKDVGGMFIRTEVKWDVSLKTATLVFLDTLPAADFDAVPAYVPGAGMTKAVDSLTFNLTTAGKQQVARLSSADGPIEIHTVPGLTPLDCNILSGHGKLAPIQPAEATVDTFPVDGTISVTFSEALDKSLIAARGSSLFAGVEEKISGLNVPSTLTFSKDNRTLFLKPDVNLSVGKDYYIWLAKIPGLGIHNARAIHVNGGSFTGKGGNNHLLDHPFKTRAPDIRNLLATLSPAISTASGVAKNRMGLSAGFNYTGVVGVGNTLSPAALKFQLTEAAWNSNHSDSVTGYQVQIKRQDRDGSVTGWQNLQQVIPSALSPVSNLIPGKREVQIDLTGDPVYPGLLTPDGDGESQFFSNGRNLFNDSSVIRIRVRPYVGEGDPTMGETGAWSDPVVFYDNAAPCDSDFVGAANANNLATGGVRVTEHVSFNNASGSQAVDTGYIEVTFPEDMSLVGAAPAVTFFYGPFGGANPPEPITPVNPGETRSRWINARTYRIFLSIPAFDFTHGGSGNGAFYSVSVAGVADASGNAIQAYGSNGTLAIPDYQGAGRATRVSANAEQQQGSMSVTKGFVLCD
jgi:hypothetical protein